MEALVSSSGEQRNFQTGWAMARGEGSHADASTASGGRGPRGIVVGLVTVLALFALVFWIVLRNDPVHAELMSVVINLPDERVQVKFDPPDGCWTTADTSRVWVEDEALAIDMQVAWSESGCSSTRAFPLPDGISDLPEVIMVRQVGCERGALACGAPVEATMVAE